MTDFSAQGSITIKRLRTGDTLFITFNSNGIPLYQGVDTKTGTVTPDWTQAANQPIVTPNVTSARGMTVSTSNHVWKYNGVQLLFNGASSGGYTADSTGKFAMNPSNGALKIIGNLASTTNYANDTIEYSCQATLAGVEYNLSKSTDIVIQSTGATSYMGIITATTEQLTGAVTSTTLSAQLKLAGADVGSYVKWYKGNLNTPWTAKNGQNNITVTRSDVDGTILFIVEFYLAQTDAQPVYRAGIRIIDAADAFQIVYSITSANKTVDDNKPVTVTGQLVNMRTNSVVTMAGAVWRTYVMEKKHWTATQSVNSDTVTVTTSDTDRDGEMNDVEVTGNVTWNE